MAGLYVNDNGTWKLPKSIWVNDGTSTTGSTGWRMCKNVYVNRNGAWQEMIRSVDLTSSKTNFNLWQYVGSPVEALSLIFNINANVEITSSDPDKSGSRTPAFTVGNFPAGSSVIVNNNGFIGGGGGYGGGGATNNNTAGEATRGGNAGYGLIKGSSNNYDCTLVNTGTIAGGGGGGGGGNGAASTTSFGKGGDGGAGAGTSGYSKTQGGPGKGAGCAGGTLGGAVVCGRAGGAGGNLGDNGVASTKDGGNGAPAILSAGIDIAVSGNIDGGIG